MVGFTTDRSVAVVLVLVSSVVVTTDRSKAVVLLLAVYGRFYY